MLICLFFTKTFEIRFISANAIDITLRVTIVLFRRLQQAKELVKQVRGYRKQFEEEGGKTKRKKKTEQTSPHLRLQRFHEILKIKP